MQDYTQKIKIKKPRKLQLHKKKDFKIKKLIDKQKLKQLSIQFRLIFA